MGGLHTMDEDEQDIQQQVIQNYQGVLSMFDNDELAYVVSQEIDRIGENAK
jgi:hypothetical protein